MDKVIYAHNETVELFPKKSLIHSDKTEIHNDKTKICTYINKKLHLKNKIKRILLKDFPVGNYTLIINGFTVMEAKCNNTDYIFDFVSDNYVLNDPSLWKNLDKKCYEKEIFFIESCIEDYCFNFDRLFYENSVVKISCNNTEFKYDDKKEIVLYGYFNDNENILSEKVLNIYPHYSNSHQLHAWNSTESIDILLDSEKTIDNAKIIVRIDGEEYINSNIDKSCAYFKIKFNNIKNDKQFDQSKIYKYKSINDMDSIEIITLGTVCKDIIHNYYIKNLKTFDIYHA